MSVFPRFSAIIITMPKSNLDNIRHSLAHLLAAAVLEKFPDAKLGIGPVIEDGFYYDFDLPRSLAPEDLKGFEKTMKELIRQKLPFRGRKVTTAEAKKIFKNQPFKLDLIKEFVKEKKGLTVYETGDIFLDLCRGGHVKNTGEINPDAFVLDRIAGAYWRGNEKNQMLTRIYGVAFNTKKELEEYVALQEEAKKRDHRKIGQEQELFYIDETVGKGLPMFLPKGATIRRELERFIVDEEIKRGYLHVLTPDLARLELYKKSGHYPYYKDSMYAPIVIDEDEFMLRPMTCPHHFQMYLSRPHSYRELPMRIAEVAKLYRYEQSGELTGLQRVRAFCLADSHIICADEEQAVEEMGQALDLIEYTNDVLGLKLGKDYRYQLSMGDRKNTKKYYKDDAGWKKAENLLRKLMKRRKVDFEEAKDEAAFYGPKIDIQMKNVNGKEDTAFTVQYDLSSQHKFNLTYVGEDNKEKRCFVVHRSSIGAIERTMAFLIEKYAGAFPTWLSPVQVSVLAISQKHTKYAENVFKLLKERNVRTELTPSDVTLGKRIREAEMQKIPYILVVGDREIESKTVNVRERHKKETETVSVEVFLKKILEEIAERK